MNDITKGKWKVSKGKLYAFSVESPTNAVAFIPAGKNDEANAKLIAEAPETLRQRDALLAACEWIDKFISTACDGGDAWCAVREQPGASEWAEDLHKAIAKATEKK